MFLHYCLAGSNRCQAPTVARACNHSSPRTFALCLGSGRTGPIEGETPRVLRASKRVSCLPPHPTLVALRVVAGPSVLSSCTTTTDDAPPVFLTGGLRCRWYQPIFLVGSTTLGESLTRRVARLWISRARLKQWVPRPCAFCKGGYRTAWSDVLTPPSLEMRSHPIPHSLARAGFVQKIEPVTARSPLFRRLDQPALHWMAMHVTQSLHALVRRAPSVPDGKKKRLKEAGPPAHRFLQRSLQ